MRQPRRPCGRPPVLDAAIYARARRVRGKRGRGGGTPLPPRRRVEREVNGSGEKDGAEEGREHGGAEPEVGRLFQAGKGPLMEEGARMGGREAQAMTTK